MMSRREVLGTGAAGVLVPPARRAAPTAATARFDHLIVRHRRISVRGVEVFYREAGRPEAPAILLMHGFPSSSHMFRHLMPVLAARYRVIAPDYPGFGYSEFPSPERFAYTFANYAALMAAFTDAVGLSRYAMYIQDYGAPIGLRLALLRPTRVMALITQNGNAYEEGLSAGWAPLKDYWREPTPERREKLKSWLGAEGLRLQYTAGVREDQLDRLSPDTWSLDWSRLNRAGSEDVQISLFADYQDNLRLYPAFQTWMRKAQLPTLVLWGANDPFFTTAGAYAFKRDVPDAELRLLDGSHFLLETHGPEAFDVVLRFLTGAIR